MAAWRPAWPAWGSRPPNPTRPHQQLDAPGALGADHQRVGFCSGLRVGARLMRSLMDSTGIVY